MGKVAHGRHVSFVHCGVPPVSFIRARLSTCTRIDRRSYPVDICCMRYTPQKTTATRLSMTNNTTSSPTATSPSASDSRRASHSSIADERRTSETWDASKVPPSQFQRPPGSIYSTPNSKDGNVERGDRDKAYFEKLKEKVK